MDNSTETTLKDSFISCLCGIFVYGIRLILDKVTRKSRPSKDARNLRTDD